MAKTYKKNYYLISKYAKAYPKVARKEENKKEKETALGKAIRHLMAKGKTHAQAIAILFKKK